MILEENEKKEVRSLPHAVETGDVGGGLFGVKMEELAQVGVGREHQQET